MTEYWLQPWLLSLDTDNLEGELYPGGLNDYFINAGVSYMTVLKNLQSSLVFLAVLVVALAVGAGYRAFRAEWAWVNKAASTFEIELFWSSTIRFVIQQYQPLVLASMVNLRFLLFSSPFLTASSALALTLLLAAHLILLKMVFMVKS